MDQTRYDVLESTFKVVSELTLAEHLRPQSGVQFELSLIVQTRDGEMPFTIWIDRFKRGETHVVHEAVDGSKVMAVTGSLVHDGVRFNLEIQVERARDLRQSRPAVRLSPEFFDLLRASAASFEAETIERLLRSLDQS